MKRKPQRRKMPRVEEPARPKPEARMSSPGSSLVRRFLFPMWIVLAGWIVYANSFRGEFILDDLASIRDNTTIRRLSSLADVLLLKTRAVMVGSTVEGRPLLNLSFALNYAWGGLEVRGYHVVNVAIHVMAGLLLFGIVRRTLLLSRWSALGVCAVTVHRVNEVDGAGTAQSDRTRACADHYASWLALVIALIWVVHPLQTESVTYVVQRAESLAGMLYLLTIYLAIRGFGAPRPNGWRLGAVIACVLGMGAKETMATAPLLVLLYDWIFVAGSWRALWRARGRFHICLAVLGWGTLALILMGTAGSNLDNVKALFGQLGGREQAHWMGHETHWTEYARIQPWVVVQYLRLSLWPHPLVFHYERNLSPGILEMVFAYLLVASLMVATLVACGRRQWMGFAGAWFFLILAPTSSVIPLSGQLMAEHRMYLPLAAIVTMCVAGGLKACGLLRRRLKPGQENGVAKVRILQWVVPACVALLLVVLGSMTVARNKDYRTSISIWRDTVLKRPRNAIAHNNLGAAYFRAGNLNEAVSHYQMSLESDPAFSDAHANLALVLVSQGELDEAIKHYESALANRPDFSQARNGLGIAMLRKGQVDRAIVELERTLEGRPDYEDALSNLGLALAQKGRMDEAVIHCRRSIEISPDRAYLHNNLGLALLQQGKVTEAGSSFEKAVTLDAGYVEPRVYLGNVLLAQGRWSEAIAQYEEVLSRQPENVEAHCNLGTALLQEGRVREAVDHFEKAIRVNPAELRVLNNLAWVLSTSEEAGLRDGLRAVELAREADRLAGGNEPSILRTLAAALAEAGQYDDAIASSRKAADLATARGNANLARAIEMEEERYRANQPLRATRSRQVESQPVSR